MRGHRTSLRYNNAPRNRLAQSRLLREFALLLSQKRLLQSVSIVSDADILRRISGQFRDECTRMRKALGVKGLMPVQVLRQGIITGAFGPIQAQTIRGCVEESHEDAPTVSGWLTYERCAFSSHLLNSGGWGVHHRDSVQ